MPFRYLNCVFFEAIINHFLSNSTTSTQPSDSSRRARKTLSNCLQMLNLLIEESTRWRDAYITICESELPILYKIDHKLPMLRSVQIRLSDADGFVTRPSPIYKDLFENAPQLRRLYIRKDPSCKVDWSGLTVIYLWYPSSLAMHLDILSRLKELTICGGFRTLLIRLNTVPPKTLLKILRTDHEDVCSTTFLNHSAEHKCKDIPNQILPENNIIGA